MQSLVARGVAQRSVHLLLKRSLSIGVVGAGQMGVGIGLVAAQAKHDVIIMDNSKGKTDKALEFIGVLLKKDVLKGKMTDEEAVEVRKRLVFVQDLKSLKNCDFCIEAIVENLAAKRELFGSLDKIVKKSTILATNTSSISITKIASSTTRPDQVIGMHFMNPVPVMKLVEIIPGLQTSPSTLASTVSLAQEMGKTTTLSMDVPGFIANRILMPYINEACFVVQEGVASREDVDTTMKLGTNVPMGPLRLADFIGLDTCLAIMRVLHTQLGDDKYRPSPLLVKYVDAGWLGKKSGRGFYEYE